MGRINFNVDSVSMREVLDELDFQGRLNSTAPRALQAGAEALLPYMQRRAPVRTGQMKAALGVGRRRRAKGQESSEVGAFHATAPHAHLVERGHGGPKPAQAHPFMQPAVEEAEEAVVNAIMAALTEGL